MTAVLKQQHEWHTTTSARVLLDYFRRSDLRRRIETFGERKIRLFACACARRVWHLLDDERSRKAVAMAEEFADDKSDRITPASAGARVAMAAFYNEQFTPDPEHYIAANLARLCCWRPSRIHGPRQVTFDEDVPAGIAGAADRLLGGEAAGLFRDMTGDPFSPVQLRHLGSALCRACLGSGSVYGSMPPTPCPVCSCVTPQVRSLAQAAYEERPAKECEKCRGKGSWWVCPMCRGEWGGDVGPECFVCNGSLLGRKTCTTCDGSGAIDDGTGTLDPVRLAVLSDALEEGGAGHLLLAALRSPGPHYRGFWPLDLILGRE